VRRRNACCRKASFKYALRHKHQLNMIATAILPHCDETMLHAPPSTTPVSEACYHFASMPISSPTMSVIDKVAHELTPYASISNRGLKQAIRGKETQAMRRKAKKLGRRPVSMSAT